MTLMVARTTTCMSSANVSPCQRTRHLSLGLRTSPRNKTDPHRAVRLEVGRPSTETTIQEPCVESKPSAESPLPSASANEENVIEMEREWASEERDGQI